jgi:hypothetical protein
MEKQQREQRPAPAPVGRRAFLLGAAVLGALWLAVRGGLRLARRARRPALAPEGSGQAPLGARERATLLALLPVVLPGDHGLGPEGPAALLDETLAARPELLPAFREAAALLERRSRQRLGAPFAEAAPAERDRILDSFLWRYRSGVPVGQARFRGSVLSRLERVFQAPAERRLREHVIRELLLRYYGGPRSWELAGQENRPGVPGDPRGYVRPPGHRDGAAERVRASEGAAERA